MAIITIVLVTQTFLIQIIPNLYIRDALLLVLSAFLYYFLAPSIIEPLLDTDEKLKEMVEHTLHELNTPIATIQANVNLLKRTNQDEKSQKRLSRIQDATKNLTKLYESIEYNIKENIEYIEKEHILLQDIVHESIQKFADIKKDITINNNVKNISLYTDKNGFEKVIDNLLSNAIKYNKKDGSVYFYTKDAKLYIEDTGIGINPKNLFIVYEKSFQENPTTLGYGLGLSIVKNFCDKEKITIKIDTKKEQGTTISLDIKNIIDK